MRGNHPGVTCCEAVPALLFSIVPSASRLEAKSHALYTSVLEACNAMHAVIRVHVCRVMCFGLKNRY